MNKFVLIRWGSCALIMVVACVGWAQQNDPRATQILQAVTSTYKSSKAVQADFNIRVENPHAKMADMQNGTLFVKGNKYRLMLKNQEVICDNQTVWTYLKDVNEVQINTFDPEENSLSPSDLFTLYEKDFLSAFVEEKTIQGKVIQFIELTPLDKSKPYFKIRLGVDKQSKTIFNATVFDKNGSRYYYEIRRFTANPQLADTFFFFDPRNYPGIEVVDLR